MQGIIKSSMQQNSGQPAGNQPSPADEGGAGQSQQQEQKSEQQQAIELAAQKILWDDKANAQVLKSLADGKDNPARAIAHIAFTLMADLDKRSGGKLPEDDLVPATLNILDEVALIADKSGTLQVTEDVRAKAVQQLIAIAIENGVIDKDDIEGLIAEYPEEEVQRMVAEQQTIAGAQPEGVV